VTTTGDGPGGAGEAGDAGDAMPAEADAWAAVEARAGRKAQRVVLGVGVGLWAATVVGALLGAPVPLLLGFAQAGGLSVSGAV
jgi:hypothetical protein